MKASWALERHHFSEVRAWKFNNFEDIFETMAGGVDTDSCTFITLFPRKERAALEKLSRLQQMMGIETDGI